VDGAAELGKYRIKVLDDARPYACSWSDGVIGLSRGLLHLMDQDETAAVVGHELGHLLSHQGKSGIWSLLGGNNWTNNEEQADSIAVVLLRHACISPLALPHALAKVRDAPQSPLELKAGLDQRIDRLTRTIARD